MEPARTIKTCGETRWKVLGGILAVVCVIMVFAGCAHDAGVSPIDVQKRYRQLDRNALYDRRPSERTLLFLRQRDMIRKWRHDPIAVLRELDRGIRVEADREALFALMELCYLEAKRQGAISEANLMLSVSCLVNAYHYLFNPAFGPAASPYHPHSRLACEYYNRSLAAVLMYFRDRDVRLMYFRDRDVRYRKDMRLPLLNGHLRLSERYMEHGWRPEELEIYHAAYEFKVEGLENLHTTYGIGVPMIVVRASPELEKTRKKEKYAPKIEQTYAATVVLRVNTAISPDAAEDVSYAAGLEIYNPVNTERVEIGKRTAPLESDFTTPLAYMMVQSPPPSGLEGLLDVEAWEDRQGLYMLQPYQRGKIPVVLVHGLMSSPETWIKMLNNLMGDPRLREHYQFWFFMYPTGNPILYSASILRDSLIQIQQTFDPKGRDPAFNQMVLVGHSMGGVLSKFMVQDSGDALWRQFSDKPFGEIRVSGENRALLERVFFFESLPFVTRAVFIAAPHRGSEWADRTVGRLGSSLVELPVRLISFSTDLLKTVAIAPFYGTSGEVMRFDHIPTGIDSLSPNNPTLRISADMPIAPAVTYHSIVGNREAADVAGGTDGIVSYASSHLENAASEKIFHAGHGVHNHPLAIMEVKRILIEHLDQEDTQQGQ
jgi:triacylglycerol esterase/lipase EstA (alpha/beta hydrolase family)